MAILTDLPPEVSERPVRRAQVGAMALGHVG